MTDSGSVSIIGTERAIVTQLVRSPGRLPHGAEGRDEAGLHREPDAGPRVVARAPDRQEGPRLRPDRPQARAARSRRSCAPCRTRTRRRGLRCSYRRPNLATLAPVDNSYFIADPRPRRTDDARGRALIQVFKKQRPASRRRSRTRATCCASLFFHPKRYDLTRVGRDKLNARLGLEVRDDCRVLTTADLAALVRRSSRGRSARHAR